MQPQCTEGMCACSLEPDTPAILLLATLITQTPCDAVSFPRSQTMLVAVEIHTLQLFFSSQQSICHFLTTQTDLTLLQDSQNVII